MLIIVSDIHLGDGTCGRSISPSAFQHFADRLKELARYASWRADGTYRPIENIDILLLGDILDPLHSNLWLEKADDQPDHVRPWTDPQAPEYAEMVGRITTNILRRNAESIQALKRIASGEAVHIPPADGKGGAAATAPERISVPVRIHYMVGNHDWYYHLQGEQFDQVRQEIIQSIGLSNPPTRFPYSLTEPGAEWLKSLLDGYSVFARHGDFYDSFNFPPNRKKAINEDTSLLRDASSLGDVFAVEIVNRFAVEAKEAFKDKLPAQLIESLSELVNVRPALATSLWISSQLRQCKVSAKDQEGLKELWDSLCKEFIKHPFVRAANKRFRLDIVDMLQLGINIFDKFSFQSMDNLALFIRKKFRAGDEILFCGHALKEEAFKEGNTQFVVYGHTHHHEIVPLDSVLSTPRPTNQMYLNSGTWHTYFDLAINKPEQKKFVPYQVLTYLAFFKDDERSGRRFETWSGAFSD